MRQLKMVWMNDGLPPKEPPIPAGCSVKRLHEVANGVDVWLDIVQYGLSKGLKDRSYYDKSMASDRYSPEDTLFVFCDGEPAATVTVICGETEGGGRVHMVACKPGFRGRGIGHCLSAVAVCELKKRGAEHACLTTDDWRVPAVKSYLKSGFLPDIPEGDAEMSSRWENVLGIISSGRRVPNDGTL